MELKELIDELRKYPPETTASRGLGNPHSYRGWYDQIAFEMVENTSAGAMLAAAESAVGATYTGWKGGDYTMFHDTPTHLVMERGRCGDEITQMMLHLMLGEA